MSQVEGAASLTPARTPTWVLETQLEAAGAEVSKGGAGDDVRGGAGPWKPGHGVHTSLQTNDRAASRRGAMPLRF